MPDRVEPVAVLIRTRVQLPGFHHWPGATGTRAYLADRHRHLFGITATVFAEHSDRDVEFHDLSDVVRAWWGPEPREWGPSSCEDIARQLAAHLFDAGYSPSSVAVDEDGENFATLIYGVAA